MKINTIGLTLQSLADKLDKDGVHFVGLSGGKDSGACAALAKYAGVHAVYFFCDTGHEKPETLAYIDELEVALGQPIIKLRKTYTAEEWAAKRDQVQKAWSQWYTPALRSKRAKEMAVREMYPPVGGVTLQTALETLRPSGDTFRDNLVFHGTMPHKTGKFCSLELKTEMAWRHISDYLNTKHDGEEVYWWSGVRAQESAQRAELHPLEECELDPSGYTTSLRPIIDLTHDDVFAMCDYVGIPLNPLYKRGDKRVGCGECFEANKRAIRNSFTRDPALLDRTLWLEHEVGKVNRRSIQRGLSYVPFFRESYRLKQYNNWASAAQIFEWSMSGRGSGGDIITNSCDSIYGLCE